jgi:NADPH-dependent curcumin reductase
VQLSARLMPTKCYLIVQRGRMEGFLVLDCMSRAVEGDRRSRRLGAGGKLKNKVDVQHGLENAPAILRRLFDGRNEGKQLLRVAE